MRVTKVRLYGTIFAVVALAAFGTQALSVFGEEFRDGYVVLMLLAVAHLVQAAAGPVTALLSVTGHQRRCLPVFGYALVSAGALIALLAPRFGIEGAALSILAVTVGWSLWLHNVVRKHLRIRPSPFSPPLPEVTKTGPH